MSAIEAAPSAFCTCRPVFSESASLGSASRLSKKLRLIANPCWNKPLASGLASSADTDAEPADWPEIVTFSGSPPNLSILRLIHWSAAIWSRKP